MSACIHCCEPILTVCSQGGCPKSALIAIIPQRVSCSLRHGRCAVYWTQPSNADCFACAGTVSNNAADPAASGPVVGDLAPAGPAPNSPEEGTQGPQASFSQRVTRNVQRALSHNGGQTPARHPAQFPASTSPAVLQGLANTGPSSQPGSRQYSCLQCSCAHAFRILQACQCSAPSEVPCQWHQIFECQRGSVLDLAIVIQTMVAYAYAQKLTALMCCCQSRGPRDAVYAGQL